MGIFLFCVNEMAYRYDEEYFPQDYLVFPCNNKHENRFSADVSISILSILSQKAYLNLIKRINL